jgi:DNA-binding transcriptional LysR family regulator
MLRQAESKSPHRHPADHCTAKEHHASTAEISVVLEAAAHDARNCLYTHRRGDRTVELRHLRYFVAIAEERSFTRAAERLWLAQPGLSTQIRRLETELGLQLFERHPRGVELTIAGELFLERARAALEAAEAASATGHDLGTGVVGSMKLGIATAARWRWTSTVLERFTRECEGIELTVLEGYGGTLWNDLRVGRLDAVVASAEFASADLQRVPLGTEPWVVLIGRAHRLAGVGPVDPADLQGEQIAITAHRDGAGHDRAVADMLSDMGVAAGLVRAAPGPGLLSAVADGSALVLTTAPDALHRDVLVRPLASHRTLGFTLLWRRQAVSPALSAFIRVTTECVEHQPALRPALAAAA